MQAAILLVKLPHLPSWTDARRRVAARYTELLASVGELRLPTVGLDRDHVYHLYVIRTDRRESLRKHLAAAGVATVLNYPKALPFCPAYSYLGHDAHDFPVAYSNQSRILSLPIYPEISDTMIQYVAERIGEFFSEDAVVAGPALDPGRPSIGD